MANDWFRKTSWTPEDERDFEDRLGRARGQRIEYLRIQAVTLVETQDPIVARPAILLAQRYLEETDSPLFLPLVHLVIARARALLGDTTGASESYRAAIAAQSLPCAGPVSAHIEFAWFVATHRLRRLYREALDTMDSNIQQNDLVWPVMQYRYFASSALMSRGLGDNQSAKRTARLALEAAAKDSSPFSSHRSLGLVSADDKMLKRVRRIAG